MPTRMVIFYNCFNLTNYQDRYPSILNSQIGDQLAVFLVQLFAFLVQPVGRQFDTGTAAVERRSGDYIMTKARSLPFK